jgi:hypothetical protein
VINVVIINENKSNSASQLNIFSDTQGIDIQSILNRLIAILGIRGSGKSNTSAVICEELLKKNIAICIIDIDGEYIGLRQRYEILIVGNDKSDIELICDEERVFYLVKMSLEKNLSLLFDLSGLSRINQLSFVYYYFKAVWTIEKDMRKPFFTILEESHVFIPQSLDENYPILKEIREVASDCSLRGRKRGIGLILISLRSAKINKDILSQAELYFLHKIVHPVDYKVFSEILSFSTRELSDRIQKLDVGEVYFVNNGEKERCKIRERQSITSGFSPILDEDREKPDLNALKKEMLGKLDECGLEITSKLSKIDKGETSLPLDLVNVEKIFTNCQKKTIEGYNTLYRSLKRPPTSIELGEFLGLEYEIIKSRIKRFNKRGIRLKVFSESDKLYHLQFGILLDSFHYICKNERRMPYITEIIIALNRSYSRTKECIKRFKKKYSFLKVDVLNKSEITKSKNALKVKRIWNILKPKFFHFGINRNPTKKELSLECDIPLKDVNNALEFLEENNIHLNIDDEIVRNQYDIKMEIIETICNICREENVAIEEIDANMIRLKSSLTMSSIHKYRKLLSIDGIFPFMQNMKRYDHLNEKHNIEYDLLSKIKSEKNPNGISALRYAKGNKVSYAITSKARKRLIDKGLLQKRRSKIDDITEIISVYKKNKDRSREYILKKISFSNVQQRLYQMKYENLGIDIPDDLLKKLLVSLDTSKLIIALSNKNRIQIIENCLTSRTLGQLLHDLKLENKWKNTIKYHLYILQESNIIAKVKDKYQLSNIGRDILNLLKEVRLIPSIISKRNLFLLHIIGQYPQNRKKVLSELGKLQCHIENFKIGDCLTPYISHIDTHDNKDSFILTKRGLVISNFLEKSLSIIKKSKSESNLVNPPKVGKVDVSDLRDICCSGCGNKSKRVLGLLFDGKLKSFTQFSSSKLKEIIENNKNLISCQNCYFSQKHNNKSFMKDLLRDLSLNQELNIIPKKENID